MKAGKKEREQSQDTKVKQTSQFPGKFALREQEIVVRHDAGISFFPIVKEFFIMPYTKSGDCQ